MKILEVKTLDVPAIKVIQFARFHDSRGYFTEVFKKSDFQNNPKVSFLKDHEWLQANVSYSKKGVIRGLHFQWEPPMDKLVRVISGRMIDLVLDIRKNSPTYGKLVAYDMDTRGESEFNEWIWVPEGFAHGSLYLEETYIEYFCTTEWNPQGETSISPFAPDIDWSLCDPELKKIFDDSKTTDLVTEKDRNGFTMEQWGKSVNSEKFTYQTY